MMDDLVSIACFVVAMFGLYFLWLTRRSGERRAQGSSPSSRRGAQTGNGPADGPRRYADAEHEHRDFGDEDPIAYEKCRKCGGRLFRARDGIRCSNCGQLSGPRPSRDVVVEQPYGLGSSEPALFKKKLSIARPEKQQPRRDGIRLSDEANAELLRSIFGEEGPQC